MIFVDFETDGFEGKVIELSYIQGPKGGMGKHRPPFKGFFASKIKNVVISLDLNVKTFEQEMVKIISKEEVVVFWHHFMPSYLLTNYPDLYKMLQGRFVTFTDAYSILDGINGRYKIQDITKNLLERDHVGTAKDDVLDLAECYYKIYNRRF